MGKTLPDDRPFFRFYPGAYESEGVFETSDAPCDVCNRPCVWRYDSIIYVAGDEPVVCARCIASGKLSAYFGERSFSLHDVELECADPDLAEELLKRTPNVSSFNPYEWPVLDGRPLAFIGHGDDAGVWSQPAARAAMQSAWRQMYEEDLNEPTPYLLVFRELDGDRYGTAFDFD